MITRIFLLSALLPATLSSAEGDKPLTPADFCTQLEIHSQVFVYDETGEILHQKFAVERKARTTPWDAQEAKAKGEICRIQSNWSSEWSDIAGALHFATEWWVTPEGKLKAKIEQYAEQGPKGAKSEVPYKGVLRSQEFLIKDMTPIIWISESHKKQRIVVRFIPGLSDNSLPQDITRLPISGDDMVVVDNDGNLWANHLTASGVFVGFDSLQGTLLLSYYPFQNAKPLGSAQENTIELRLPGRKPVSIYSKTSFVPAGTTAKVYVVFYPEYKTKSLRSQGVTTTDEEDRFLKSVQSHLIGKKR